MAQKKETTRRIDCPSCGGAVEIRYEGISQSVSCRNCGSVIDLTGGKYAVIGEYALKKKFFPPFELGTRGKFEGQDYEFIGYLHKKDNEGNRWQEFLLFNPYLGYRYLSNWNGHWNFIHLLRGMPFDAGGRPILANYEPQAAYRQGKRFKFFTSYTAGTEFVMGEFNYRVVAGEEVKVVEYLSGTRILNGEFSANESVWAMAEYKEPQEIASAFGLEKLPDPVLVAPNQPNPFARVRLLSAAFAAIVMTAIITFGISVSSAAEKKTVFHRVVETDLRQTAFKTQDSTNYKEYQIELGNLDLPKDKQNFEFEMTGNVSNSWMFVTLFLMNETTQKGFVFTKEISYYSGYSGGEYWSEGDRTESVFTETLPKGEYFALAVVQTSIADSASLELKVKRDVVSWSFPVVFMIIILIMAAYYPVRYYLFEMVRQS